MEMEPSRHPRGSAIYAMRKAQSARTYGGAFFIKSSDALPPRQTLSFAVACLLRKTISTPLAQGNGFTHGAIAPAFLRGVGAASHLPCRSFAAAYRLPLKVILFLKAKTLYAIAQKNIKIFFYFFGTDAIVQH